MNTSITSNKLQLPKSSTSVSTVIVGLVATSVCMWLLFVLQLFEMHHQAAANTDAAIFLVIFIGLPMALWEVLWLKSYKNPAANLARVLQIKNTRRVLTKWLGLAATYAALCFFYWLLPLYRQDFYKPFMEAASGLLSTLLVLALPYIAWVDKRQTQPEQDAYYKIGSGLLSYLSFIKPSANHHWLKVKQSQVLSENSTFQVNSWLKEHFLAWGVKFFFLPLMFGFICENLSAMSSWRFHWQQLSWAQQVEHLTVCIFMVDLLWGSVGYLWSLKICDSHIRSTEPTLLGWAVALAFYAPFNQVLGPSFFAYETNVKWHHWLASNPEISYLWGGGLLMLHVCFVWATVVFGLRFSNLTNRGIITSGPYRFFKHPAYICKNLSWWMIAMPFMVTTTALDAARSCLILLLANLGYYLRAKTEERHLLQTCPQYAEYCSAMSQTFLAQRAQSIRSLWRRGQKA